MLNHLARTLPDAAAVTEILMDTYGPEQFCQIQQLAPKIFRAYLTDGRIILAWVDKNGEISCREMEAV